MPYGYGSGYGYSPGAASSGGGAASSLSSTLPYLQLALQLAGTLSGDSGGERIAGKVQEAGRKAGAAVRTPSAPSILSNRKQAGAQVGEFAAGFIPVVGPAISGLLGGARQAKTQGASQDYLKQILSQNPDLFDLGGAHLQAEYAPSGNFLANYAASQPSYMRKVAKAQMKLGKLTPIENRIGQKVLGEEEDQAEREREIHRRNVRKVGRAEEEAQRKAREQGAGMARPSGQQQAMAVLPLLLRLLSAQQGGGPQP